MNRQFWVLVHRYAGLYMAFFLIVAGLTGSVLAFAPELDRWLNPPLHVVPHAGPRLDELTLRERAQALAPHGRINDLQFMRDPDDAYTATIEPRTDSATGKPYDLGFTTLTLDPYTGAEISRAKMTDEGFWPLTRHNILGFIFALHYSLVLPGSIGLWLFGVAALLWTIDCFVGVYLTFPISVKRRVDAEARATPEPRKSWWQRWKPAWLVRWRGGGAKINFDLHRAGGLWVWLMLLVLAWSSVGFNLGPQIYTPVMKAVFGMPDAFGDLPTLKAPRPDPALDWREAHAIGQRLMGEQAKRHAFHVEREAYLFYVADKGVFEYVVHSDRDVVDDYGGNYVLFDGDSGQFKGLDIPTGENLGSTINSWIFALHMALVWGLPFKLFVCVVGLIVAMLSVTGVLIWLKKRRAAKIRQDRQRRSELRLRALAGVSVEGAEEPN